MLCRGLCRAMTSRPTEGRTVRGFLASASVGPSALLIEGEPGIGKTTLWLAAVEQARARGFRVLSARAAAAESVLAYTALADLLDGVDAAAWADLPAPQRLAVDQVLLRADNGTATDQRAVAAAFLSVVERLADDGPVLLAIDDLQWLDPSSMHVVAFARAAAHRTRRVILAACAPKSATVPGASWLQMPRPDAVNRIRLQPVEYSRSARRGVGTVAQVVLASDDRPHPRGVWRKPFLRNRIGPRDRRAGARHRNVATAHAGRSRAGTDRQPRSRRARCAARRLMHGRADGRTGVERHDQRRRSSWWSCSRTPRARASSPSTATGSASHIPYWPEACTPRPHRGNAERCIDGSPRSSTNPNCGRGTWHWPRPAVTHVTLRALDDAAESARMRGAPAAAAELMDLAIGLGGDYRRSAGCSRRSTISMRVTANARRPCWRTPSSSCRRATCAQRR